MSLSNVTVVIGLMITISIGIHIWINEPIETDTHITSCK